MTHTHTPGPWIANENLTPDGRFTGTYAIWTNETRTKYIGEIVLSANAALIARAPELLAENERLRAALQRIAEMDPMHLQAAYLAKAEARAALAKVQS